VHAGTAEPLRVSPPEAVAYLLELARQNETIPNQLNQPTNRPTLRWVFQVLEGIERVRLIVDGQVRDLRTGLNEVKIKILRLFSEQVCHVYQLPAG
jgi:hypothetical protein